jgi:hypothetical protein
MATKQTTKKKAVKKQAASAADLLARLGPVREVVRMTRAHDTTAAYNLVLSCKHVRVGTKRKSLRCGRCRKGGAK